MKNINLIPAAILSAACVVAFSAAAQGQALIKRPAQAFKIAEKTAARLPKFKMQRLPNVTQTRNASAVLTKWRGVNSVPTNVEPVIIPQEQMVRLVRVQQKRLNAQAQLRPQAALRLQTLQYRDEILKGYHLPAEYLEGFFLRRIFPYQQNPSYTPNNEEGVLFRGMLVTPEELAEILRSGFSPAHSKWNTGANAPAVSLSSSSVEAMHYIFQSGFKKDGIGVVFKVRQNPSMELGESEIYNSTQTIYYSYENIPAEDIVDVLVRGEYGLESLSDILAAAKQGKINPHGGWTGQFNGVLR